MTWYEEKRLEILTFSKEHNIQMLVGKGAE